MAGVQCSKHLKSLDNKKIIKRTQSLLFDLFYLKFLSLNWGFPISERGIPLPQW